MQKPIILRKGNNLANGEQDLTKMSPTEKKQFLSMDLVERMIRVEQQVAATFNRPIHYSKTQYFNSLTRKEKINFERYLKEHKRRGFLYGFLSLFSLFVILSFGLGFTGGVIGVAGSIDVLIVLIIFLALLLVLLAHNLSKIKRKKRFEKHFNVIHGVLDKKRNTKR